MLHKLALITSVALLAALGFSVHASAIPQTSGHAMGGADHSSGPSNCSTICTSAAPYKDEFDEEISDDEKDKELSPFYLLRQTSAIAAIENAHEQRTKIALGYDPPPGLPAYILLTVFRA